MRRPSSSPIGPIVQRIAEAPLVLYRWQLLGERAQRPSATERQVSLPREPLAPDT
ncbi:MAG TPA: hypothetical protein VIM47_08220 [Dermatophilaceae bacterium]|jgi:hypothetical protein